jgi:hypothetical protein
MKHFILCTLLAFMALSACSLFKPKAEIIEYPKPDLKANYQYFIDQKILYDLETIPEVIQNLDLQYSNIGRTDDLFGGLDPDLPMIFFYSVTFDHEVTRPAVYTNGCMGKFFYSYLIYLDGKVQLLSSAEDMAKVYAPIKSENEALSYALALTGYHALYELQGHPEYEVLSPPLEETHVEETDDGYIVHLFDTDMCGCGPHVTPAVDILVRTDGSITENARYDAFRDPELDRVCFD